MERGRNESMQTLRAVPGVHLHGWGPRGEEGLVGRAPPACGPPTAARARQPRALQPCEAGTTSPLGGSPTVGLPLPSLQETLLRVSICEAIVLHQALGQTTASELIHEPNSSQLFLIQKYSVASKKLGIGRGF